MKHYTTSRMTSPALSICIGYIYIAVLAVVLYLLGFYSNSTFFTWGVPVNFMGVTVTNYTSYFILIVLLFIHQIINNWINTSTYPWIINCVQDEKSSNLLYSKRVSLLLVNMFALYSELDVIFVVSGMISQIVFVLVIILANFITTSLINWQYIKHKADYDLNEYNIV
jgi:hypothetical protein